MEKYAPLINDLKIMGKFVLTKTLVYVTVAFKDNSVKKYITLYVFLLVFGFHLFAEASFSGIISAGASTLNGTTNADDSLGASGFLWGRLQVNIQDEEGIIGGVLRIKAGMDAMDNNFSWSWYNPDDWATNNPYAWVWWKPVEQLKIQLGFIDDFAVSDLVAWSFNGNDAEDSYVALAGYYYTNDILHRATGFYNGTWWTGASVTVKPISDLSISAAIPYQRGNASTAADVYQFMHGQVTYLVKDVVRIAVSFEGKGSGSLDLSDNDTAPFGKNILANASSLYASFFVYALEDFGLSINVGFAYTLPAEGDGISYTSPMAAGLGLGFNKDRFDLKLRFAASFAGSVKQSGGASYKEPLKLGFGVNPSYDFSICKLYFNAGVSFTAEDSFVNGFGDKIDNSAAFGWHINPYVTKRIGSGVLYAGVQLESYPAGQGYDETVIKWGIPIAIQLEF